MTRHIIDQPRNYSHAARLRRYLKIDRIEAASDGTTPPKALQRRSVHGTGRLRAFLKIARQGHAS